MIVGPPPPSTPRHKKYPTKGPTAPPRESPQYSPRSGCRASRLSLWNGQPPSLQPHDGSTCSARRDGGAVSLSLTKRRPLQALAGWVGVPLSCSSWRGPGEAVWGAPFHRPLCGVRWGWGLPGQKRAAAPQGSGAFRRGALPQHRLRALPPPAGGSTWAAVWTEQVLAGAQLLGSPQSFGGSISGFHHGQSY